MATKEIEKTNITGLDQATNRKEAEYDLVKSLLEAADYKESDSEITEAKITRGGKYLFSVFLHPLSEADARFARKQATTYMKDPRNKKLPPIEKEVDNVKMASWIIYLASCEDTQKNIWGNPAIMQKYGLQQPWESVDILLKYGEKEWLSDIITEISGMDNGSEEEETVSVESFRGSSDK